METNSKNITCVNLGIGNFKMVKMCGNVFEMLEFGNSKTVQSREYESEIWKKWKWNVKECKL